MLKRLGRFMALCLSAAAVGTACSDSTGPATAPLSSAPEASQQALLGGLIGTLTQTLANLLVPPVTRNAPLANDVSWSFTAGPAGAASSNADVGLTIVFPPNAVATNQVITVTALKGSAVAYKFEPHGLVFAKKVVLTQDLRGTSGGGLLSGILGGLLSTSALQGAYFATDRLETTSGGLAKVNELVPALSSALTQTVSFGVEHFSGYIVASGRSGGGYGY